MLYRFIDTAGRGHTHYLLALGSLRQNLDAKAVSHVSLALTDLTRLEIVLQYAHTVPVCTSACAYLRVRRGFALQCFSCYSD